MNRSHLTGNQFQSNSNNSVTDSPEHLSGAVLQLVDVWTSSAIKTLFKGKHLVKCSRISKQRET